MELFEAIEKRRSIRSFKDEAVSRETLERILHAALKAPSARNAQPWRLIVLQGGEKTAFCDAFGDELTLAEQDPQRSPLLHSARASERVMREAPVLVCVIHDGQEDEVTDPVSGVRRVGEMMDLLSIGAMVENLALAAKAEGLDTLWIGDTVAAEPVLRKHLGEKGMLVSVVCAGLGAEKGHRPKAKDVSDVLEFRG